MPVITAHADHATLINVFTVEPERARQLADLLTAATEEVMQHIAGFISANIPPPHRRHPSRQLRAVAQRGGIPGDAAGRHSPATHGAMCRVGRRLRPPPVHR